MDQKAENLFKVKGNSDNFPEGGFFPIEQTAYPEQTSGEYNAQQNRDDHDAY